MSKDRKVNRQKTILKLSIIALLWGMFFLIGYYFYTVRRTGIVYTHFAYVPIALAGLWWGRKSVYVALIFAVTIYLLRVACHVSEAWWSDIARTFFFLVVAVCVGLLSEKAVKAREAMELSEENYRSMIENSFGGVLVLCGGSISFVNVRFCEMIRMSEQRIKSHILADLLHDDDKERFSQLVETGGTNSALLNNEYRFIRGDGSILWAEVVASRTVFEGKDALLLNIYDITPRKEAEEKRKELQELSRKQEEQLIHSTRLAELGEMAASVAHELNQPLTGIKNYAKNAIYMLENDPNSKEEVEKNLRRIVEQVDKISKIITQMRKMTRKTDRQLKFESLNEIIKETIDFLAPQFKVERVQVVTELDEDIPLILADKIKLEQVFLNILVNACQAMSASVERRIRVRTYLSHESKLPIVAEIADTGRGFSQEEADKLFMPFYTTKKEGEGTGLGLTISQNIVKEHGGEIEALGAPGVGAVFKVMLPLPKEGGEDGEVTYKR